MYISHFSKFVIYIIYLISNIIFPVLLNSLLSNQSTHNAIRSIIFDLVVATYKNSDLTSFINIKQNLYWIYWKLFSADITNYRLDHYPYMYTSYETDIAMYNSKTSESERVFYQNEILP